MKKLSLIISLGVLFCVLVAMSFAQVSTVTANWFVGTSLSNCIGLSTAGPYIDTGSLTRGMAYSTTEQKLIEVNHTGPHAYVLNQADGNTTGNGYNQTGQLSLTGVSGGTFVINKVRVAGDGTIYVANLATPISTQALKIYQYTSTAESAPYVSVNTTIPSQSASNDDRFGDGFGVTGTGTNTQLYVSGLNNITYALFTTPNGNDFVLASIVTTNVAGFGSGEYSVLSSGNYIWADAAMNNNHTLLFNTVSGMTVDEVNTGAAAAGMPCATVITPGNGETYILKETISSPVQGTLVDITQSGASTNAFTDVTTIQTPTANSNANQVGASDYDPVLGQVYFLFTNNGIGQYTIVPPLPVELSDFAIKED